MLSQVIPSEAATLSQASPMREAVSVRAGEAGQRVSVAFRQAARRQGPVVAAGLVPRRAGQGGGRVHPSRARPAGARLRRRAADRCDPGAVGDDAALFAGARGLGAGAVRHRRAVEARPRGAADLERAAEGVDRADARGGDRRPGRQVPDLGGAGLRRAARSGARARPGDQEANGVSHIPVLIAETLAALAIKPGGLYLDATFGAGGYTRAMLERGARVVALDRDPAAIAGGAALAAEYPDRLRLVE